MVDLTSGRVLITGASSGIGAAAAREFARCGAELFLVARRRERLSEIAKECQELGSRKACVSPHNLSIPGEGAKLVRECIHQLGGLEVLICNAGYGLYGPLEEVPPEEMARVWQVNFQSAFESIHEALPLLRRQGQGHIVLTSSVLGKKASPYTGPYCATKFAQVGLGEALWGELRGSGLGVTVICPGPTETEYQDSVVRMGGTDLLTRTFRGQNPEVVARGIVRAVRKNRRELVFSGVGKLYVWMSRLSPALMARITAFLARREREGKSRKAAR